MASPPGWQRAAYDFLPRNLKVEAYFYICNERGVGLSVTPEVHDQFCFCFVLRTFSFRLVPEHKQDNFCLCAVRYLISFSDELVVSSAYFYYPLFNRVKSPTEIKISFPRQS